MGRGKIGIVRLSGRAPRVIILRDNMARGGALSGYRAVALLSRWRLPGFKGLITLWAKQGLNRLSLLRRVLIGMQRVDLVPG